jgi:hypothetical protein
VTAIYWVEGENDRGGQWIWTNTSQTLLSGHDLRFDHAGKLAETICPDGSVRIKFADGAVRVWLPDWGTRWAEYLL